jgi:hypothetical protein
MLRRVTSYRHGAATVAAIGRGATGAIGATTDTLQGGAVAAGAVGIVAKLGFCA